MYKIKIIKKKFFIVLILNFLFVICCLLRFIYHSIKYAIECTIWLISFNLSPRSISIYFG